jgi:hypothetical protein
MAFFSALRPSVQIAIIRDAYEYLQFSLELFSFWIREKTRRSAEVLLSSLALGLPDGVAQAQRPAKRQFNLFRYPSSEKGSSLKLDVRFWKVGTGVLAYCANMIPSTHGSR